MSTRPFSEADALRPRFSPELKARAHRVFAVLQRYAFPIFLLAVVGVLVLVWLHAVMFAYLDAIPANETTTWFGGELTVAEIQAGSDARGRLPGFLSILAYALWPLQFPLVRDVIGVGALFGFVNLLAMFAIWWERKVAARIQSRLGPMRVGRWHGWAQSLADGLKLVQKEDLVPAGADGILFRIAPYLAFVPVFAAFAALPFAGEWVFRDLDVALIFIFALLGIDVMGVIIAGWASNNKWSVYGAMREACQMVSYEIPMGLSLLVAIMTVGTLRLSAMGELQSGGFHTWLVFANPFTFLAAGVFFVASLASCKRAPFDLPEAESELVAGYHTEYSGFRWGLFFFAEYSAMFIVSGLLVILFLGGWNSPLPEGWGAELATGGALARALHGILFSGPLWFVAKAMFIIYVQMWMRWTLPRLRIDQVMYMCVQVLVPMAMVLLLGNTLWQWLVPDDGRLERVINILLTIIGALFVIGFFAVIIYGVANRKRLVGRLAVDALPGA